MKIILEGEEEVGSVNLDNFIRDHKSKLGADVVVSPTRGCSRVACRRSAMACAVWCNSRSICAAAAPIYTRDRLAARSRNRHSSCRKSSRR